MTEEFLAFSISRGNDLSTPRPEYGFEGLRPGDRWCVCASRWLQAREAGVAPPIDPAASAEEVKVVIPSEVLEHADLLRPMPDL